MRRATPPSVPPDGDGRMNAFGSRKPFGMRVLSPRMLPPVTATRRVDRQHRHAVARRDQVAVPSASMNVLLPTPGGAGDPDADGLAGVRHERVEHLLAQLAMLGAAALEQRDAAGHDPPVPRPNAIDVLLRGEQPPADACRAAAPLAALRGPPSESPVPGPNTFVTPACARNS